MSNAKIINILNGKIWIYLDLRMFQRSVAPKTAMSDKNFLNTYSFVHMKPHVKLNPKSDLIRVGSHINI